MKKLFLAAAALLLMLPATAGAQSPTPTPTPTGTPSASASPDATPTASPSATATATPTTAALQQTTAPTQIFAGRTLTRGLAVLIAGQGINTGVTNTRIASDTTADCAGVACASAAGAAEPAGTTVSAQSPGNPSPAPVEAGSIPEPLTQGLAGRFGAASASTTDQPSATGDADGITLDVTLTQSVVSQLPPEITGPLNDGLAQITGALGPIAEADPTGAIQGVTDTLNGLLGNLEASPLVTIQGGQSSSTSSITGGVISTTAETQGTIITLAPTPDSTPLLPEGLAVIEIGASAASATADGTNPATGTATGSIARITLLPGILDALPDIDPGEAEGLPLDDLLDLLPDEVVDLLPDEVTGLLGGGSDPSPTPSATASEEGSPLDDILPGAMFMQADEDSGGFVIDLETGTEQTCILEDTPLATCITLGGTSQTLSEDGLGIGVLAAGVDVSLLRDATGNGQVEISVARSEAGAAADFAVAAAPAPTGTPQTGLPATGGGTTFLVPALGLMALGGSALVGLRRRR